MQNFVKQPETFHGKQSEDVRNWFTSFNIISKANTWNNRRKIAILPAFLGNLALDFWQTLSPNLNFDEIEQQFIEKFSPVCESDLIWNKIQGRFQQPNESIDEFVSWLLRHLRRACPSESDDFVKNHARIMLVNHSLSIYRRALLNPRLPKDFDSTVLRARQEEGLKSALIHVENSNQTTKSIVNSPSVSQKGSDKVNHATCNEFDSETCFSEHEKCSNATGNQIASMVQDLNDKFDQFFTHDSERGSQSETVNLLQSASKSNDFKVSKSQDIETRLDRMERNFTDSIQKINDTLTRVINNQNRTTPVSRSQFTGTHRNRNTYANRSVSRSVQCRKCNRFGHFANECRAGEQMFRGNLN